MSDETLPKTKRTAIEEIEHILNHEEDVAITILPNGTIKRLNGKRTPKVLTMRENLGGEYAQP